MDSTSETRPEYQDVQIVAAMRRALLAMSLVNGCSLNIGCSLATLRFDEEMLALHEALLLLGVDSTV